MRRTAARFDVEAPPRQPDEGFHVHPVALTPRRPVAPIVAFTLVAAFVMAAVAKPWEVTRPDQQLAGRPPSESAAIAAVPTPSDRSRQRPSVDGTRLALRLGDDLRAAAAPRAAWGVRAVVRRIGSGENGALALGDRWLPIAPPASDDTGTSRSVQAGLIGDAVLAIEVTTPPDALILDLRAWRIDAAGAKQPIAPRPVRGPEAGSWLWLPDLTDSAAAGAWPPGTYRLEALAGPRVFPIELRIPGPSDADDLRYRAPPPPSELVARISSWIGLGQNPDNLAGAPLITDRDLGASIGDGTCGGSATISGWDQLVAIVHATGWQVTHLRVFAIDTLRRPDVKVRFASDPVSGLTVMALPTGGLAGGQYAVIADVERGRTTERRTYTICVS